jgi:hypothetical protein
VDVEAVREGERSALPDIGLDEFLVNGGVMLVGQQHHDDVGALDGLVDLGHVDAALLRLVPGGAALPQADGDLHAGVLQVLRVSVALRAVADDGDLLALHQRKIGVLVVIDLHLISPGKAKREANPN